MDILHTYKSRRNSVQLIKAENGIFVQKQYPRKESCIHEQMIYRLLHNTTLPHPEVAGVFFDRMTLVPLPGKTLLEELEEQEKSGIISWGRKSDRSTP